jgi:hypothetical protein
MIEQPYPYFEIQAPTHYSFESIGDKGHVTKIVTLTLMTNGNWNLGFGDLIKGKISDSVITNNNDVRKVIGTVAKIAIEFLMQFPHCTIEVRPVDERRSKLYNLVFQRYFDEITTYFNVWGITEQEKESYQPTKTYHKFTIKLKF